MWKSVKNWLQEWAQSDVSLKNLAWTLAQGLAWGFAQGFAWGLTQGLTQGLVRGFALGLTKFWPEVLPKP